jgi:hypothetical protein
MKEIYKDIPNYQGKYQASNLGNIKSIKFKIHRILKPSFRGKGYYAHKLYNEDGHKIYSTHQLVAMTFLGHQPDGTMNTIINHIDNNPLNNNVNNLEIIKGDKANRINCTIHKNDAGVHWNKQRNNWQANIQINGKRKYLGSFTDKEDALKAYQEAWNNL